MTKILIVLFILFMAVGMPLVISYGHLLMNRKSVSDD